MVFWNLDLGLAAADKRAAKKKTTPKASLKAPPKKVQKKKEESSDDPTLLEDVSNFLTAMSAQFIGEHEQKLRNAAMLPLMIRQMILPAEAVGTAIQTGVQQHVGAVGAKDIGGRSFTNIRMKDLHGLGRLGPGASIDAEYFVPTFEELMGK